MEFQEVVDVCNQIAKTGLPTCLNVECRDCPFNNYGEDRERLTAKHDGHCCGMEIIRHTIQEVSANAA